jgi:hypothetical protein
MSGKRAFSCDRKKVAIPHFNPGWRVFFVLAEELAVLDADAPLWDSARSLLEIAFRLEQNDETYAWHGWHKQQIATFLQSLPAHCTLLVGVWETLLDEDEPASQGREALVLGFVCEVVRGDICSLRTFEALHDATLPPIQELEPGFEHARELMRVVRAQVAPAAWALFTDKATWDEWLFADRDESELTDKGELLAELARQGRCVLMGTQTIQHHL